MDATRERQAGIIEDVVYARVADVLEEAVLNGRKRSCWGWRIISELLDDGFFLPDRSCLFFLVPCLRWGGGAVLV